MESSIFNGNDDKKNGKLKAQLNIRKMADNKFDFINSFHTM